MSNMGLLEVLLEGRHVPHVLAGQGRVPVGAVLVLALHGVVAQVDRLVEVRQAELLRAEAQVALPEKHAVRV